MGKALFTIKPPPSTVLTLLITFKVDRALSELEGEFASSDKAFLAIAAQSILSYLRTVAISYLVGHVYRRYLAPDYLQLQEQGGVKSVVP